MEQFLSKLKKNTSSYIHTNNYQKQDIFFLIDFDEKGAFLTVVNAERKKVETDYHQYSGDVFHVLRSIDHIRQEQLLRISWEEDESRIYLSENPYLLYQLIRCTNLIDCGGKLLSVSRSIATVRVLLARMEKDISATFVLAAEDDEKGNFRFLSDSFALAEGVIYPIHAVGENYTQIPYLQSVFPESMIERYLEVLFSYIEHIQVSYEDYKVEFSDQDIKTVPAIIFEKVDSDKALYLRLEQTIPQIDTDFLNRFDLAWAVSLTVEHKILLRHIVRLPINEEAAKLYKMIQQYSPDRQAAKEIFREDNFFIIPAETAGAFLLQALPALLKDYRLIGADKLREYKVKPFQPQLNLSLSSGIDFLEGDATLQLGEESFSLKDILAQYQKQKYILLSDGNRAIIESGYIKKLERIFKQSKDKKKVKISFFDLPEIEDLLDEQLQGETFARHRKIYEGFNGLAAQTLKLPKVKAELRPYQTEGIKWIKYLYDNNLGGCLADDMGLGKTIQTIAMLTLVYPKEKKPALIVMPRSLLFNWQNELKRFAPKLTVYTYYGNDRNMEEALKQQVILTTYAIVRNDVETFRKQQFHYVILDESQNIKNVSAQTTQAVLLLNAPHRLALSGTPVENNLTELYSLYRFLNPAMFGSLEDFNSRYTYPIQRDNDKDTLYSLRRKIFPFMLRRLKKDVLTELPDRIDQTLYVEMEKDQARFYEQRRLYYYQQVKQTIAAEGIQKSQFVMFQALNELRRIASVPESLSDGQIISPKLEILSDALTEAVSNGHKVVVFFNYIAGIELMSERLDSMGIDYACMTGSTTDRKSIVERFQHNASCMVLLMTLKTGGVGLNLTAADTVFIFEPWWNKAAEEQAINRLHRFGQTAKVLSYSLITQGTIEEKIHQLQQRKAELFEGLIGSDSSSSKQLTEEDINYILG